MLTVRCATAGGGRLYAVSMLGDTLSVFDIGSGGMLTLSSVVANGDIEGMSFFILPPDPKP